MFSLVENKDMTLSFVSWQACHKRAVCHCKIEVKETSDAYKSLLHNIIV
jgi:hypothetical protein